MATDSTDVPEHVERHGVQACLECLELGFTACPHETAHIRFCQCCRNIVHPIGHKDEKTCPVCQFPLDEK